MTTSNIHRDLHRLRDALYRLLVVRAGRYFTQATLEKF